MRTRAESVELLNQYIENKNLRHHCRMVAAAMEAYAHKLEKFQEEIEAWWTAGSISAVKQSLSAASERSHRLPDCDV